MSGVGGQAPAIVQELCKDWTDKEGHTHPGIYDEDNEDSIRWAENYKNCKSGCLKILEPRAERNNMFEATKILVPLGAIRFSPMAPKYDVLVLDDGTEHKLSKAEMNSLIQMDLMKDEMIAIVRIKSPSGNVTYQLPPEKKHKMNDDRNYVAVMACWYIKKLRDEEEFNDDGSSNSERWLSNTETKPKSEPAVVDTKWGVMLGRSSVVRTSQRKESPFNGRSPFVKNK